MALTPAQQRAVWQALAEKVGQTGAVRFTKADLKAAAVAVDAWASSNAGSYNTALPEPFKGTATAAEKNLMLAYVCLSRAGLLVDIGS